MITETQSYLKVTKIEEEGETLNTMDRAENALLEHRTI